MPHYHNQSKINIINRSTFNSRYVTTDVLLLVDVLEKYRKMCWDRMGLEALCYVSLPSLTFDACMKLTKTKLEIVKDIDMLQMIELGIRGWSLTFNLPTQLKYELKMNDKYYVTLT